ncbi:MAG TPA: hypothetical protein VL334_08180 [Anaerolineae bacterium]|nr:hypothetical protein [Anaerolineae bacterium]
MSCRNPMHGLVIIQDHQIEIPICTHDGPCHQWDQQIWQDLIKVWVVNQLQQGVYAKQLELNVRELTTEVEALRKAVGK